MFSPHTMFRQFLHNSSCWDVDRTLEAIFEAFSIMQIDSRNPVAPPVPALTHYANGNLIKDDDHLASSAKWPKLCEAICLMDQRNVLHNGILRKFVRKDEMNRPEGYQW